MSVVKGLAQLFAGGVLLVVAAAMCTDKKAPAAPSQADAKADAEIAAARAAVATERERRLAEHREKVGAIQITKVRWYLDGFGHVLILAPTLKNTGTTEVRDIRLSCDLFARSGTVLGSVSHVVYDVLPAGKTRSFPEVNLGFVSEQSAKIGCDVADAQTF